MSTLREIAHLVGHKDHITSISVPEDGPILFYTSSRDKKVYAWAHCNDTFCTIKRAYENSRHYVQGVTSTRNGTVITCGADSITRIYTTTIHEDNVHSNSKYIDTTITKLMSDREVKSVAINSAEDKIVTGCLDGTISLWDINEKKLIDKSEDMNKAWVNCVAFNPTDDTVVAGYADGYIRVWDYKDNTLVGGCLLDTNNKIGTRMSVNTLSITPDGTYCAYGGKDCEVFIIHLESGKLSRSLKTSSNIIALAFALTDPIIAVATKTHILVWNVVSDKVLAELPNTDIGKSIWCTSLVWCKNMLLTGFSSGIIKAFELNLGEEMN